MKKLIFRHKYLLPILALLCLGLVAVAAEAAILDYQFFGDSVSGEYDDALFDSASFEIHIFGDSANVQQDSLGYFNSELTGQFTLSGGDLGTTLPNPFSGFFSESLFVFCDSEYIGFGTGSPSNFDDLSQLEFYMPVPLSQNYDLMTAFGPYLAESITWAGLDIGTSLGGNLAFASIGGPNSLEGAGFQATEVAAVPIPPALLLLGSGLIGMIGIRKKFMR